MLSQVATGGHSPRCASNLEIKESAVLVLWCLAVPVLSAMLLGVPLRGLLTRGKLLDRSAWR